MYPANPTIDLDSYPLYVDARTDAEFALALAREDDLSEGDLSRGRLFRFLNMSGWQNNRPQRFAFAKIVGPR